MSSSSHHDNVNTVSQIISEILYVACSVNFQSQSVIEFYNGLTLSNSVIAIDDNDNIHNFPTLNSTYTNNTMTDDVVLSAAVVPGGNSVNKHVVNSPPPTLSHDNDAILPCIQPEIAEGEDGTNELEGNLNGVKHDVNIDVDNIDDDDEDDGIEIVSLAVVQPTAVQRSVVPTSTMQPILLDSDSEMDDDVVVYSFPKVPEVDANPPAGEYISIDSDNDSSSDIVICSLTERAGRTTAPVSSPPCSCCADPIISENTTFSRCKHVLCPACTLKCVVEGFPAKSEQPVKSLTPVTVDKEAPPPPENNLTSQFIDPDSNSPSDHLIETSSTPSPSSDQARRLHLRPLPKCMVPRCGAPLNRTEALCALGLTQSDDLFASAFQAFEDWLESPPGAPSDGHGHIEIVPFEQKPVPKTVTTDSINGSVADVLPEKDSSTALMPFWKWDENHTEDGIVGCWQCSVCGGYESLLVPTLSSQTARSSSKAPPSYPHCAYARALGVAEYIKCLDDSREGNGNRKPRESKRHYSSATGVTTRSRRKSRSNQRSSKRRKIGFAKGTGYAGNRDTDWSGTCSSLMEEKVRIDEELTHWLQLIRWFLFIPENVPLGTWPGFMRLLLKERGIVLHISAILINESIMDIQERVPIYLAALEVVHAICDCPALRSLATLPGDGDQGKTIAELVESLSKQAAVLSTGAGREGLAQNTVILVKQIRKCIRLINRHNLVSSRGNATKNLPRVGSQAGSHDGTPVDGPSNGSGSRDVQCDIKEKEDPFADDKEKYVNDMRDVQFQTVPGLAKQSVFYAEVTKLEMTSVPSGKRQRRIAGEVASLISSLPLSWSSTILLRVDEDRYDFLRAVIFGPEDTPYDSGAFVFDIWLPLEYPSVPPKFRLLTTGGGRVRFNPNLYNCGKVCLSLLGTWSGPSWTPASTILQVLVSIQSLVLVQEPYFNEPGYENHFGTPSGEQASKQYNERVRKDNALFAIQYNIRYPCPDLEGGIRRHFILKRRYIRHFFQQWFSCWDEAVNGDTIDMKAINKLMTPPPLVTPDPTQPVSHTFSAQSSKMSLAQLFAGSASNAISASHMNSILGITAASGPGRTLHKFFMNPYSLRSVLADLDGLEAGKNANDSSQ